MRRVVITGAGLVSCLGNDWASVVQALRTGQSGIAFNPIYAEQGFKSCVSGSVEEAALDTSMIDRKLKRFLSKPGLYAYISAWQALAQAGLSVEAVAHNPRIGVVAGSAASSTHDVMLALDGMRAKGLRGVGAMTVPKTMSSTVSAALATGFKLAGVNYSIASACATSAHCVGHAMELIQLGKQDVVLAGGGELEDWTQSCMFDAMGALSTRHNDTPTQASRPYDAARDGFVIAGGGGMVVVESLDHALARGAPILAELVGYGATSDGVDMVAPSGEGAVRCMQQALAQAGMTTVDYLNTHGTSTPIGDVAELGAVKTVFHDVSGGAIPAISSTKSMTGHSLGAAGVHELIYCLMMLQAGFIAPNINVDNLDEAAQGFDIVTEPRAAKLDTIMTNSFGFGGTNASLIIRRFA